MDDLLLRIERHAADILQVARRGLLQHRVAIVRVAAVFRPARLDVKRLDDARVGHRVRLAHAEVEEFRLRLGQHRRPLRALDLLELVDGRVLAIPRAADPLGKKILDVAFLHRRVRLARVPGVAIRFAITTGQDDGRQELRGDYAAAVSRVIVPL